MWYCCTYVYLYRIPHTVSLKSVGVWQHTLPLDYHWWCSTCSLQKRFMEPSSEENGNAPLEVKASVYLIVPCPQALSTTCPFCHMGPSWQRFVRPQKKDFIQIRKDAKRCEMTCNMIKDVLIPPAFSRKYCTSAVCKVSRAILQDSYLLGMLRCSPLPRPCWSRLRSLTEMEVSWEVSYGYLHNVFGLFKK